MFTTKEAINYFNQENQKKWYKPISDNASDNASIKITPIEEANVKLIQRADS